MRKKILLLSLFVLLSKPVIAVEWNSFVEQTLQHQNTIHGWCTKEKASRMMNLIRDTHPLVCVEVGVFGGSSIYPTAKALKYQGEGIVYAIDSWETDRCLLGYEEGDPNYTWWKEVDLGMIYESFIDLLERHQLNEFVEVMVMTGTKAVATFQDESIDILHIDGNHSEASALSDAMFYLKKVKPGGYIWFDDINWSSTSKAVSYLTEYCSVVTKYGTSSQYILLKKHL